MYEENVKTKFNIDWKSLIIKMAIVLIALFIIIWIISIVNKDKKDVVKSNISENLQIMKDAAYEYFNDSRLPQSINGKKKVTLGEMINLNLLEEVIDQNSNSCDNNASYAEATRINSTDYTIKVKLVCNQESDYIINTIKSEVNIDIDDNTGNSTNINNTIDTNNNNGNSTSTNTNNTQNNSSNNSGTNSNSSSNTSKPNTNTTKPNTTTTSTVKTCKYGKNNYSVNYPLVYQISGDCAVAKSVLNEKYADYAYDKGASEYKKLVAEMIELKTKTGANIYLESPTYYEVLNKAKTGYVGFQVKFVVKQNINNTSKVIYEYYLSQNGNRTVIADSRNSLYTNVNNTQEDKLVKVTKVNINNSLSKLYEGESITLNVTINPSNATNKDVTWTSSNKNIVRVNSNGKITALKEGKAYITATVDGVSDKILVNVYENKTYTYCKRVEERIYSTGFAGKVDIENKNSLSYGYMLEFTRDNISNVSIVEYGNLDNTTSEYRKAYNYLKGYYTDKPIDIVANNSGVDPLSYTNLMKHSLKSYNMKPTVTFNSKNATYWYFNVNIKLYNLDNVIDADKFYTSDTYWVYFVPLYFDIEYADLTDCVEVSTRNEFSYQHNSYYIKIS